VYKGSNISGYDPLTDKLTALYNPRKGYWEQNFKIQPDGMIQGLTSIGRTTVDVLNFNEERRYQRRKVLKLLGEYPCLSSKILSRS